MSVACSPFPSSLTGVAPHELALRGLLGLMTLGACTEQRAQLEGQPGVYFEVAADPVREVPRAAIRLGDCYGAPGGCGSYCTQDPITCAAQTRLLTTHTWRESEPRRNIGAYRKHQRKLDGAERTDRSRRGVVTDE